MYIVFETISVSAVSVANINQMTLRLSVPNLLNF